MLVSELKEVLELVPENSLVMVMNHHQEECDVISPKIIIRDSKPQSRIVVLLHELNRSEISENSIV